MSLDATANEEITPAALAFSSFRPCLSSFPRMAPIVLQHGLFGFGELEIGKLKLSYFHKIDRALKERGHPIIVSRVHPTGPIELRAGQLKETILRQMEIQKLTDRVVILAHS